jgi:hypothetical protein
MQDYHLDSVAVAWAVAFLLAVAACGYSVLTAVIAVVKSAVDALGCIATVGVARECSFFAKN